MRDGVEPSAVARCPRFSRYFFAMVPFRPISRHRRLVSLLLAGSLLACVLAATAVVALGAAHDDCPGEEHCPVCQMVQVAKASLNFVKEAPSVSCAAVFAAVPPLAPQLQRQVLARANTLMWRKIRLNN